MLAARLPLLLLAGGSFWNARGERATTDVEAECGEATERGEAAEETPISVQRVSLEELHRIRLSRPSLISSVSQIEGRFPPWEARPKWCSSCGQQPGSQHAGDSLAEVDGGEDGQGKPGFFKLGEALARAMIPTPAAGSCTEAKIDLAFLGFEGLTVTMGFEGTLAYDTCSWCYNWEFKAVLAFEYALTFFGHGLVMRAQMKGEISLKEMRCEDADSAAFCKYLHIFLPAERGRKGRRESTCHSDSPFEILKAYLRFQWESMRQNRDVMGNITTGVERDLVKLEVGLRELLDLFLKAPASNQQLAKAAREDLQKPERLHIANFAGVFSDGKRYVWLPQGADRICMSEKAPPHGGAKLDAVQLREHCPATLPLEEVIAVKAHGKAVVAKARSHRELRILTKSEQEAKDWAKKLSALHYEEMGQRLSLSVSCENATLAHGIKFPYCTVETTAQAFATSVAHGVGGGEQKRPWWKEESVTLQVQGYADMVVSIADRGESDPLGSARLVTCSGAGGSGTTDAQWRAISNTAGCEINGDRPTIARIASKQKTSSSDECKSMCASLPSCVAVDYFANGWCNFFSEACKKPKKSGARSFEMVKPPCHHVPTVGGGSNETGAAAKLQLLKIEKGWTRWYVERVGWVQVRLGALPSSSNTSSGADATQPLDMPMMRREAQAIAVAFRQWFGKIPDYSLTLRNAILGIGEDDHDDSYRGINYKYLDGRFMARWPSSLNKAGMDEFGDNEHRTIFTKKSKKKKELSSWEKSKQSMHTWWAGVKNKAQSLTDARPCVQAQLSDDDLHDDRVLNFKRAINESVYLKHPAHRLDFYSELATSLGNLLVRSVKDVHALFSIYFADDPSWDGDCTSLTPEFNLPYELDDDAPDDSHGFEWKPPPTRPPKAQREYVNHRAAGVAGVRGKAMSDAENPFCLWPWVSSNLGQEERAAFAAADAPVGGDIQGAPRDQAAHLHPHIWCRLVEGTRQSALRRNKTSDKTFMSERYADGMGLKYRASCNQLKQSVGGFVTRPWNRYECESAVVSSSVLTILPSLGNVIRNGYEELGNALEDVLQCTGRITPSMRQFEQKREKGSVKKGFSAAVNCTGEDDFQLLVNEADNVTRDGKRSWEVISEDYACEENHEGISRYTYLASSASLNECKDKCESDRRCVALDYYHDGTGWCNLYHKACTKPKRKYSGSASYRLINGNNVTQRHLDLVDYVKHRTQDVIDLFLIYLKEIGSVDTWEKLQKDFHNAFAFEDLGRRGALFTGTLWREGLEAAKADMGSRDGLSRYIEDVKEHVVLKAWRRSKRHDIAAIFPPPVRYETTMAISLGANWMSSGEKDHSFFCKRSLAQGAAMEIAWRNQGVTYQAAVSPFDVVGGRPCIQLRLVPMSNLVFEPGLCIGLRKDPLDGGNVSWGISWHINALSMISNKETSGKQWLGRKLGNLQVMLAKSIGMEGATNISDDEMGKMRVSACWQILKDTLTDPQMYADLAKGVVSRKQFTDKLWVQGKKLVHSLKDAGRKMLQDIISSKWLADLKESIGEWLQPVDLTLQSSNVLSARIELSKVGSGPWFKTFNLHYLRRLQANLEVVIPGAGSARTSFIMQSSYDLSEVFDVVFGIDNQDKAEGPYACCVLCLADPHTAFCRSSSGIQCMNVERPLRKGETFEQMLNCDGEVSTLLEDCSAVADGDGDEEFDVAMPKEGCRAPKLNRTRSAHAHAKLAAQPH